MRTHEDLTADGWDYMLNIGNQAAAEATIVALRIPESGL